MTPLVSGIHFFGDSKLWSIASSLRAGTAPAWVISHTFSEFPLNISIKGSYEDHKRNIRIWGFHPSTPGLSPGTKTVSLPDDGRWWGPGSTALLRPPLQWLISTYLLRSTSFLAMKPAELCPFSWSPLLCCLGSAQRPGGSFRCARIEPAGGNHNPFCSVEQMGTGQLVALKILQILSQIWETLTQNDPNASKSMFFCFGAFVELVLGVRPTPITPSPNYSWGTESRWIDHFWECIEIVSEHALVSQ